MPQLAITLLGSFQVAFGGEPITDFATDKVRALLAYLVVERDHPHRRESLAGLLWPDQPESRARQSLRQALSYLRQALPDPKSGEPFLSIDSRTVQFGPGADVSLDVAAFAALGQACRQHRHRDRSMCLPCLRRQETMVSLYLGEFLTGFSLPDSTLFEEWMLLKREWLHIQAIEGLAILTDYNERRGALATARRYARRQVQLEPWREEAHHQLMRLLARSGERSAALRQYQQCRRILAEELGVEPMAETKALYESIKQGVSGFGVDAPSSSKPLPPAATPFVGREVERAEVAELLADPECRLVTLVGPGGIGKTRLALQVADDHQGLFGDGPVFVPLEALGPVASDAQAVASAIADALGVSVSPGEDPREHLVRDLSDRDHLIVLDGIEHLLACCDFLATLLRHATGIVLLVTSRETLRLYEEWVYQVGGLRYADGPDAADLAVADALVLFEQRAMQVNHRFRLTEDLVAPVARICQLVGGAPLGVELAAAAVVAQSCTEIAGTLEHDLDSLTDAPRNAPDRHRSLRAAFEHSWVLLSPAERDHLSGLSAFEGGLDAGAAQAVAGATRQDLAALQAKSLVGHDGDGRFRLHAVTRQYAAEKLSADPARASTIRDRHSAHYADLVASLVGALSGPDAGPTLSLLSTERANLQAAWLWAVESGHLERLEAMLGGLVQLYGVRGPLIEGAALLRRSIEQLAGRPERSPELLAQLYLAQARLLSTQARYAEAIHAIRQASHLPVFQGEIDLAWGRTLQRQGAYDRALPILSRALESARFGGAPRLQADALRELGNTATRQGALDQASGHYEAALSLYAELGDASGQAAVQNNLSVIAWTVGEYEVASQHLEAALEGYRRLGDLRGEAKALTNLSSLAADTGDIGAAVRHCEEALAIHRQTGNHGGQSAALNNLGAIFWQCGQYDRSRACYEQALELHRAGGNRQGEGETLGNLALLHHLVGDDDLALRQVLQAIEIAEALGDRSGLANALTYRGKILIDALCLDDAERSLRRAGEIREDLPHSGRTLELTVELAHLALLRQRPAQAYAEIVPVLTALDDPHGLDGTEEPYRVYGLTCGILRANRDPRADPLQQKARHLLTEQAARISDPELRRSLLEDVAINRELLAGDVT